MDKPVFTEQPELMDRIRRLSGQEPVPTAFRSYFVEIAYTYRDRDFTWRTEARTGYGPDFAIGLATLKFNRTHMDDAIITGRKFY
jgi:hypothetical protein